MKILELFTQQKLNTVPTNVATQDDDKSGHFSTVKTNANDPHTVIKTARKRDNAYNSYADFIMHNKLAQSNPHFPRIYTSAGGKHWEMEKLQNTLREYLMDETTTDEEFNERFEMITNLYIKDKYTPMLKSPHLSIGLRLRHLISALKDPGKIKLESYKEAIETLHAFISKNKFEDDIRDANIMIRRTPVGPQLVLLDPVFDRKDA